jgi:hypothetical protein
VAAGTDYIYLKLSEHCVETMHSFLGKQMKSLTTLPCLACVLSDLLSSGGGVFTFSSFLCQFGLCLTISLCNININLGTK